MNFGELKTLVVRYAKAENYSDLAGFWVNNAGRRIGAEANLPQLEKTVQVTTTTDAVYGTMSSVDLPEDCGLALALNQPRLAYDKFTLDTLLMYFAQDSGGGKPYGWAVSGRKIYTAPGGGDFILRYRPNPPELVNDEDTNDWVTGYPQTWIFAAMLEASIVLTDPEQVDMASRAWENEVSRLDRAATQWNLAGPRAKRSR